MSMKKISFVINTARNELENLKLLLHSLQKNLDVSTHQILVFIDSDNQGTYEWLKSIQGDFHDLKIITHSLPPCIGYSRNNNLLVELADHDIVSYLQSDMVISPGYDTDIIRDLEDNCILSSTRVEPPLHGESPQTITKDFGLDPEEFNFEEWNEYSQTVKEDKLSTYFFAPITFYKKVWLDLGGYNTYFRRSREDSDFVQRCVHEGVKLKQTHNAVVYHFTCTSSRGKDWHNPNNEDAQKRVELQKMADMIELKRFIRKWGSFNHGETKLEKYDVDLCITNAKNFHPNFMSQIEPLASRVWVDSDLSELMSIVNKEHDLANILLGFSNEQWEKAKKYYNTQDYTEIYKNLSEFSEEYNIKVEVDASKFTQNDANVFNNLHAILSQTDIGDWEYGNIVFKIRNKKVISSSTMKNPEFDKKLLKIE